MLAPSLNTLNRALMILARPTTAVSFADQFWPDRVGEPVGARSRAGHALLAQLVRAGEVGRVGDGSPRFDTFIARAAPEDRRVDRPMHPRVDPWIDRGSRSPIDPEVTSPLDLGGDLGGDLGDDLGSRPVEGVEHDSAYGNVVIRSLPLAPDDDHGGWPVTDVIRQELRELVAQGEDGTVWLGTYSRPVDDAMWADEIFVTLEQAVRVLWLHDARRRWLASLSG